MLLAAGLVVVAAAASGGNPWSALLKLVTTHRATELGIWGVLASLCWAYGVLNLLPLAGLDGGQILATLVRLLVRRSASASGPAATATSAKSDLSES